MIKQTSRSILSILDNLPENHKVLDVGGSFAPFKRAKYIIDIAPYEKIDWTQSKGIGESKLKEEDYLKFDICSREHGV